METKKIRNNHVFFHNAQNLMQSVCAPVLFVRTKLRFLPSKPSSREDDLRFHRAFQWGGNYNNILPAFFYILKFPLRWRLSFHSLCIARRGRIFFKPRPGPTVFTLIPRRMLCCVCVPQQTVGFVERCRAFKEAVGPARGPLYQPPLHGSSFWTLVHTRSTFPPPRCHPKSASPETSEPFGGPPYPPVGMPVQPTGRGRGAGFHWLVPCVDRCTGRVSLRLEYAPVHLECKTKDQPRRAAGPTGPTTESKTDPWGCSNFPSCVYSFCGFPPPCWWVPLCPYFRSSARLFCCPRLYWC